MWINYRKMIVYHWPSPVWYQYDLVLTKKWPWRCLREILAYLWYYEKFIFVSRWSLPQKVSKYRNHDHMCPRKSRFQTGSEFSSFVSSSLAFFFELLYNIFQFFVLEILPFSPKNIISSIFSSKYTYFRNFWKKLNLIKPNPLYN